MKTYKYIPDRNNVKVIVQIIHGAKEHFHRYSNLVDFLNKNNIAVFGHDLPSHGANYDYELNHHHFNKEQLILSTLRVSEEIKQEFPNAKHIIIGHSMGSLIVRHIIVNNQFKYDKVILSGTTNPPSFQTRPGIMLFSLERPRSTSEFNNKLIFDTFSKRSIKKGFGENWLSTSDDNNSNYEKDPLCGNLFSNLSLKTLLELANNVSSKSSIKNLKDKSLPIICLYGVLDPVGNFGKEIKKFVKEMKLNNYMNINLIEYQNSKHEIIFDVNSEQVFKDILKFINE